MLVDRTSNFIRTAIWAVWLALSLNIVAVILIGIAAITFREHLSAMQATFLRCSVGIRWVERHMDQGDVIVVDDIAYKQLQKELEQNGLSNGSTE